jgi:uncharacterized protein (TIGR03083 family)
MPRAGARSAGHSDIPPGGPLAGCLVACQTSDMTEGIIDAPAIARAEFERRLTAITDDDWGRPTPCTEWNVRQLVNHIVSHEYRYADNLATNNSRYYVASRDDDFLGDVLRAPAGHPPEHGNASRSPTAPGRPQTLRGARLQLAHTDEGRLPTQVDHFSGSGHQLLAAAVNVGCPSRADGAAPADRRLPAGGSPRSSPTRSHHG